MFHKNSYLFPRSVSPGAVLDSNPTLTQNATHRLVLLPPGGSVPRRDPSPLIDLVAIAAHRCSSFFAEAAVLVLVLALLDRFMLKGRMELDWVVSAFTISLVLLGASVLTEFTSRRWLQRR